MSDAEKLFHACISSHLEYCNSLFTGITGENITKTAIHSKQRCQDPDESIVIIIY